MSVFWVYAGNAIRFEQSYRAIATTAKVPGHDDPKVDTMSLVRQWLESEESGDWLMILDNADDAGLFSRSTVPSTVAPSDDVPKTINFSSYLPRHPRGSILVTTRSRQAAFGLTGRDDRIIKVERMGKDDATALLKKKLPHDASADHDWTTLVETLEYLPLAITQAAAYVTIKAPAMTISKYLEHFRRSEADQTSLLGKHSQDLRRDPDVPNAVAVTWQISFDQIKRHDPPAADLLSRMCVLDRQGIPGFLFCPTDDDRLAFEDAMGTLLGYSFVDVAKSEDTFLMHPLVQLSTRKWLETCGELDRRQGEALTLLAAKFPTGDHAHWKTCEALQPRAERMMQYRFTPESCQLEQAAVLYNMAWYAWARGNYDVALEWSTEAVRMMELLRGRENLDTMTVVFLMAVVVRRQGKYDEAEQMYREVSGEGESSRQGASLHTGEHE